MRFPGIDPAELTAAAARTLGGDPGVGRLLGKGGALEKRMSDFSVVPEAPPAISDDLVGELPDVTEEVIVQRLAPVYRIVNGAVDLSESISANDIWGARVEAASATLAGVFPAIGRIEARLAGERHIALGTAWLIDPLVAVTNRHVVDYFAEHGTRGLSFKRLFGRSGRMGARIDFADDATLDLDRGVSVEDILFLSPKRRPDIALVRLARSGTEAPASLELIRRPLVIDDLLCVVGYPEQDDRADRADVARLFGDVFGRKRLAPGLVRSLEGGTIRHLCNTLGGNSGSPVLDLETGKVAGLHFGGRLETENYAEPADVIDQVFRSLSTAAPGRAEVVESSNGGQPMTRRITIPINVTVEVGDPIIGDQIDSVAQSQATTGEQVAASLEAAVAAARTRLAARDDVVAVRAGWKVTDGWITDTQAIVVALERKLSPDTLEAAGRTSIPQSIAGFPVDIALADPVDLFHTELVSYGVEERAPFRGSYKPRPQLPLERAVREMRVRVQPGPDAGSAMLKTFLAKTDSRLTVAMYRFSAPHLLTAAIDALGDAGTLKLVLDMRADDVGSGAKKDDLTAEETVERLEDALDDRVSVQRASTGKGGVFASSYHIKVAVRDGSALWMSSGSWQSSNQPATDPLAGGSPPDLFGDHNREFHVVVEDEGLARRYEEHIEADFEEAGEAEEAASVEDPLIWLPIIPPEALLTEAPAKPTYFKAFSEKRQFDVQPILSPDNYAGEVLDLIRGARSRIWFQNQSFGIR